MKIKLFAHREEDSRKLTNSDIKQPFVVRIFLI